MQTSAFRVEVIRFSLLVTLTVALLSVAIRLASHNDAHSSRAGAQPTPTTAGTTSAPSTSTSTSTSTAPPVTTPVTPVPRATESTPTPTPTSTSAGGSGETGAPTLGPRQVLPVTGDDALKLIALSMVLIGGGALTVRGSRR